MSVCHLTVPFDVPPLSRLHWDAVRLVFPVLGRAGICCRASVYLCGSACVHVMYMRSIHRQRSGVCGLACFAWELDVRLSVICMRIEEWRRRANPSTPEHAYIKPSARGSSSPRNQPWSATENKIIECLSHHARITAHTATIWSPLRPFSIAMRLQKASIGPLTSSGTSRNL